MDSLPFEIVYSILYWIIHPRDAVNCMLVCTLWRDVIDDIDSKFEERLEVTNYQKMFPAYSTIRYLINEDKNNLKLLNTPSCDYILRSHAVCKRGYTIPRSSDTSIIDLSEFIIRLHVSFLLRDAIGIDAFISGKHISGEFVVTIEPFHHGKPRSPSEPMYYAYIEVYKSFIRAETHGSTYQVSRYAQGGDFAFYLATVGIKIPVWKFVQGVYLATGNLFL